MKKNNTKNTKKHRTTDPPQKVVFLNVGFWKSTFLALYDILEPRGCFFIENDTKMDAKMTPKSSKIIILMKNIQK